MIVTVDGSVKRSYVEALCLLFYPGAKFPADEPRGPDTVKIEIVTRKIGDTWHGSVTILSGGETWRAEDESTLSLRHSDELTEKIAVGKAFLAAGAAARGIRPLWGILTGVRPAKFTSSYLAEGMTDGEAAALLSEIYLTDPHKASLAVAVSKAEARLITPDSRRACSVYVAIPFCPSRCAYCSFVSCTSPRLLGLIPDYLDSLLADLTATFRTIGELGFRVSTVYIGGGTPTTLDASQLNRLLTHIGRLTDVSKLDEFTVEAGRPDTITPEKLAVAKAAGVTRISVNPQTLNEDVLRHIGRRHTVEQFFSAYETAAKSGIRDINVDLIAGLETDTAESFRRSLDGVLALRPQNITVHTFSVKRAADVLRENKDIYLQETSEAEQSVAYSQAVLPAAGYGPYYMYRQKNMVGNLENVGYAVEGHEGLYNVFMMEEVQTIFGVGASAVTKLVKPKSGGGITMERIFEPKYPYEYLGDGEAERRADKTKRIFGFFADGSRF